MNIKRGGSCVDSLTLHTILYLPKHTIAHTDTHLALFCLKYMYNMYQIELGNKRLKFQSNWNLKQKRKKTRKRTEGKCIFLQWGLNPLPPGSNTRVQATVLLHGA